MGEGDDFERIENLLILMLLRDGVDYELISEVTGIGLKSLYARFPKGKVGRNVRG